LGTAAGSVNVTAAPEALEAGATVPHVAALQPVPARDQLTPLFAESFATVAVKACVAPVCTLAVVADMATVTAGGVGVGVPPPLLPLPETFPVQPEIKPIAILDTKATQRMVRPVRN